jgi:hypothetical protein
LPPPSHWKEIAKTLRDKILSPAERAQYRLRGDIIAKLILAMEKLEREKKAKGELTPIKLPWKLERIETR